MQMIVYFKLTNTIYIIDYILRLILFVIINNNNNNILSDIQNFIQNDIVSDITHKFQNWSALQQI